MSSPEEEKRARVAQFSLDQISKYTRERNFARAFPHYLVFAQLKRDDFQRDHVTQFVDVTHGFVEKLKTINSEEKIAQVYDQALEVLPTHPQLLTNYGSYLFNCDQTKKAESLFRQALKSDPKYLIAKDRLENLSSSLVERWHFPMLNDETRNSKFEAALGAVVRRVRGGAGSCSVLDIGAGTGLLSLLASRAGADTVVACEVSEVMSITAREVFVHNPEAAARVKLVPKLSVDLTPEDLPDKVSVVVTETFDCGLLGEHALETLHHALTHLLEAGGRVVPAGAELYVAPIQSGHIAGYSVMDRDKLGYLECDVRVVADFGEEPYQAERLAALGDEVKFLASPQKLFSVNFEDVASVEALLRGRTAEVAWEATRDGSWDAVAAWFRLSLDQETSLSTEAGSCWEQAVFPVTCRRNKVYRQSSLGATFRIQNHVAMEGVTMHHGATNGNGTEAAAAKPELRAPPSILQQLNSGARQTVAQWAAYYCARDLAPGQLLDCSLRFPDISLQILSLQPAASLSLVVDTGPASRRRSRQLLDLVTRVAAANGVAMARIDCLPALSAAPPTSRYSVVTLAPVTEAGTLSAASLQQVAAVTRLRGAAQLLPHSLELWCVAVASRQLEEMTRLVSDDKVAGLRISDQVDRENFGELSCFV